MSLDNSLKSQNYYLEDDEIDLFQIVFSLWKKKIIILIVTSFIVFITAIISFKLPKQFQSKTTFYIHQETNSKSNLMGYASLLGINNSTNIESMVSTLLKSKKIKTSIAKKYQYLFDEKIQLLISKNKLQNIESHILNYVVNELKLSKNLVFSKSKEGLVSLSYYSPDADMSKNILLSYLLLLEQFNKELEISAEKKFITIIDPPEAALGSFKPKIITNLLFGFIFGIFISSTFIILYDIFKVRKT